MYYGHMRISGDRAPLNFFSSSLLFSEVDCLQQSLKAMLSNCNSGVAYIAFILNLNLNHECCCGLTTIVVVLASVSNQNRSPLNFSLSSLFIEVGCLQQSFKGLD